MQNSCILGLDYFGEHGRMLHILFNTNNRSLATCFHTGYLLGLYFDPEDGGRHVSPNRRLTFNRLHGVLAQKMELFRVYESLK
jgi:hypothetical protein